MKYTEYKFTVKPQSDDAQDVLAAMLGESGFETFETEGEEMRGYVQTAQMNEDDILYTINKVSEMMGVEIEHSHAEVESQNWNETWEKEGFQPIVIGERLVVHSTEHTDVARCEYDIKINPCMAFGTGSHETTRMLLGWLLDHEMTGRRVIDAGCGTGILGILAMMRGANSLLAYDIDEWSSENAKRNIELNSVEGDVRLGDSRVIEGEQCDLLIANINRNILLGDMERFAEAIEDGGTLLISGFYREDVGVLEAKAARCGLAVEASGRGDNGWCWIEFSKTL